MYETLAYILTDCEGGNLVSAQGVGGNVPLVVVKCSPYLEVAIWPCHVRRSLIKTLMYISKHSYLHFSTSFGVILG